MDGYQQSLVSFPLARMAEPTSAHSSRVSARPLDRGAENAGHARDLAARLAVVGDEERLHQPADPHLVLAHQFAHRRAERRRRGRRRDRRHRAAGAAR